MSSFKSGRIFTEEQELAEWKAIRTGPALTMAELSFLCLSRWRRAEIWQDQTETPPCGEIAAESVKEVGI